jgi:hypothetical protein
MSATRQRQLGKTRQQRISEKRRQRGHRRLSGGLRNEARHMRRYICRLLL